MHGWRTQLLQRENAAGHRLLPERRLFNAALLQGGGKGQKKVAKRELATVVVRWNHSVYLKEAKPPTYPAEKLKELGWKLQSGKSNSTRHVLQGPAPTQRRLLPVLRSAWKGKLEARGQLSIAPLDAKRCSRCKACLKTYGSASKKPPSSKSGGKLWCSGKSRWNKQPAARTPSKTCRQCLKDLCLCKHVGARSGRTHGCSRCSHCL